MPSIWQGEENPELRPPKHLDILLGVKQKVNPFDDIRKLPRMAYLADHATENIDEEQAGVLASPEAVGDIF